MMRDISSDRDVRDMLADLGLLECDDDTQQGREIRQLVATADQRRAANRKAIRSLAFGNDSDG